MMPTIESPGEYRATTYGTLPAVESVVYSWTVRGPRRVHRLRWIDTAYATTWGIGRQTYIEVDGERHPWGHTLKAACESAVVERRNGGGWRFGLIGRHILQRDLPCCGGGFVCDKDHGGYVACVDGHCEHCGTLWLVDDGNGSLYRQDGGEA